MRSINPLHIGALLVVIIMFLFFKLSSVKSELDEARLGFKESQKLAVNLTALQSVYANKDKTTAALRRIFNNRILREAKLLVLDKKNYSLISAKKINTKALNFLMSKVLNSPFIIEKLKIVKLNDKEASLEMEIKW
ncbi:hypothetical protein [Sulfurimonas sp.]